MPISKIEAPGRRKQTFQLRLKLQFCFGHEPGHESALPFARRGVAGVGYAEV